MLRPLDLGKQGFAYQTTLIAADDAARFATVTHFAAEQLADYASKTGDLHAAVDDYRPPSVGPNGRTISPRILKSCTTTSRSQSWVSKTRTPQRARRARHSGSIR